MSRSGMEINLEAMACRAPVVASWNRRGIREVVVDALTGYLVPFAAGPGDKLPEQSRSSSAKDLALRIAELLDDPKKARAMGEAGRKREEHFSWTAIAAQTIDLYRSLIAARK